MAERATVARPFATALFRNALKGNQLADWEEVLGRLQSYCRVEALQNLFKDPRVEKNQLTELVAGLVEDRLPKNGRNFLDLLAQSGRLELLPEIASLFTQLRREHEKTADVTITSAMEIGPAHLDLITKAMERRLGRKVRITTQINPEMVGGAVIRIGDQVIDGSMRGRLEQLSQQLGQ